MGKLLPFKSPMRGDTLDEAFQRWQAEQGSIRLWLHRADAWMVQACMRVLRAARK